MTFKWICSLTSIGVLLVRNIKLFNRISVGLSLHSLGQSERLPKTTKFLYMFQRFSIYLLQINIVNKSIVVNSKLMSVHIIRIKSRTEKNKTRNFSSTWSFINSTTTTFVSSSLNSELPSGSVYSLGCLLKFNYFVCICKVFVTSSCLFLRSIDFNIILWTYMWFIKPLNNLPLQYKWKELYFSFKILICRKPPD